MNFFDHERFAVERLEQLAFAVEGAPDGLDVVSQELGAVHLPLSQVGGDDERSRWLENTVDLGRRGSERPSWQVVDGVERRDTRERSGAHGDGAHVATKHATATRASARHQEHPPRRVQADHHKSEFDEVLTNLTRTAAEVEHQRSGLDPPGEAMEDLAIQREMEEITGECRRVVVGHRVIRRAHDRGVERIHHEKSVPPGLPCQCVPRGCRARAPERGSLVACQFAGYDRECAPTATVEKHCLIGRSDMTLTGDSDDVSSLPQADQDAIGATLISLMTGFRERDAERLVGIYTSDADWVNAFGSVKKGGNEIVEYLRGLFSDDNFNAGTLKAPPETSIRVLTPDVVLVSADLQVEGQKLVGGGEIEVRDNHSLRVLQRQSNGSWLIVSEMYNDANRERTFEGHS